MTIQDTNRRLTPKILRQDIEAHNGLRTIAGYQTTRPEATLEALDAEHDLMIEAQRDALEKDIQAKAAADKARLIEWRYHNGVLAMKEVVKGQFGSDSDEAAAVGLKKKSERKRPSKHKAEG